MQFQNQGETENDYELLALDRHQLWLHDTMNSFLQ
jgi:hypothetical protein